MSDDLIRRSDAIEAIEMVDWYHQNRNKDMVSGANSDEHQAWYKAQDIYEALEAVPKADRPQGEWIPCSERLPRKERAIYLICTESGYMCSCRWTNDMYGLGSHEWSKWGWHIMDKPQYAKVVAWMEMKPWKGADGIRDAIVEVYDAPTIEPKRGEWMFDEKGYFRCSECGRKPNDQNSTTDFCPWCGANMQRETVDYKSIVLTCDDEGNWSMHGERKEGE